MLSHHPKVPARVSIALTLFISVLVFSALSFIAPLQADAGAIERVKGKQAIVSFDDTEGPIKKGTKLTATEDGKKKAILQVIQYKNGKAKVKIVKGKAKAGMEVVAPEEDSSNTASTPKSKRKRSPRNAGAATLFRGMTVGILGGYAMDSQTVKSLGAMSGSGFSVRAFGDIPVSGSLNLFARAGAEQFNVVKDSSKTDILYAAIDLMLKYSLSDSGFVPFIMGGLGLHFPISKQSVNALNANKIASTTVFYGGAGFNKAMGADTYFQLTAEYGMFPPSTDVTTSLMAVRGGLGFRF